MASTIKGITVKIAGETTDLQKALKNIQSSSRSLQAELKTINSQLKFDPDNTVLLTQKQDVLREQIKSSTSALQELNEVKEQVEEQAKNGEISADQFRAYQREVEKTKSQLENFEKQLADTEAAAKAVDMKSLENEMSDVKTSATELKDVLADTAAGIGAALGAAGGSAIAAITSANSEKKALNSLQAQTGLTKDELLKYKSVINDIYKNNFGESQEEIADTLAKIKQFTGETDPGKMKELAENLYTLQDTFGYDIPESLRAVNMLMEQFGISSTEAFNLVVQGSQRGLDKNGDFLDTLNEYSVHYQQMGYNANEFINSLANGTAAGTFSVDKLGDAMKEFGIRVKDTSTSTQEGFNLLGYGVKASAEEIQKAKDEIAKLEQNLSYAKAEQAGFNEKTSELTKQKNADKIAEYSSALETAKTNLQILESAGNGAKGTIEELQAKFAAGGDTAKEATQEVLQELFNMDDKIKQNQVGVDLFGTMWEDLGADGVKALMEINGTANLTKDSMQKIKDIKYDDVESDWESLGRTIKTDVINPIGKSLFPEVKKLCDFTSKHTDKIIPVLETVGSLTAGIWAGKKVSALYTATSQLVNSYKVLKTATEGAALAQEGLNLAQKANAIGAVVSIATTLIGTIYAWSEASRDNSQELDEWQEKIDVAKEKNKELTDSYQTFIDKRNEKVSTATSENQYYDNLWEELQKIVDENGKVNSGYEDRAKFITTKLSDLTGTEIKLNDGVIDNYKNLRDTIQEVIDKKKANNILSAYESNYNEAVTNTETQKKAIDSAQSEYEKAQEEATKAQIDYNKSVTDLMILQQRLKSEPENIRISSLVSTKKEEVSEKKSALNSARNLEQIKKNDVSTAKKQLQEYLAVVDNYENLQTAILNENEENTSDALRKIQNDFITAKSGTEETLKQQCVNYRMRFTEIQQAIAEGKTDYYTADDLTNMQLLLQAAEDEYNKYCQNSLETGEKATSNVADGIDKNSVTVYESANKVSKKGSSGFASDQHERVKIGSKSVNDYASGIDGNSGVAREAGVRIGKSTRSGVRSISLFNTGNNFVQGFINGISSGDAIKNVLSTATGIGGLALGAVKKILGINSPSREAKKIGSYFTEGLVIGINDNKNKVKLSTENLASSMLGSFDFEKPVSYIDMLNDKFNNIKNLDNAIASRSTNKVVTNSPKVELNYYGDVNINTDLDIDNFNERVSNAIIDTLSNEY